MDEGHLAILESGSNMWSAWRTKHPKIRPDLSYVDLEEYGFRGVDLSGVDLSWANLRFTAMNDVACRDADLRFADLRSAELRCVDFQRTRLEGANFGNADLRGADLRHARLSFASLRGAKLRGARLQHAHLEGVNLCDADLRDTDLSGLNLRNAHLVNVKLPPSIVDAEVSSSTIDWRTAARLRALEGLLPLLCRTGMPSGAATAMIEQLRAIDETRMKLMLQSVWLAHSPEDEAIAATIRSDLEAEGVTTWFYPRDSAHYVYDLHLPLFERLVLLCTPTSIRHVLNTFDLNGLLERDWDFGAGNIVIPVLTDEAVFGGSQEAPVWWPKKHWSYRMLKPRIRAQLSRSSKGIGGRRAQIESVIAQLRLSVDREKKVKMSREQGDRVMRGPT